MIQIGLTIEEPGKETVTHCFVYPSLRPVQAAIVADYVEQILNAVAEKAPEKLGRDNG